MQRTHYTVFQRRDAASVERLVSRGHSSRWWIAGPSGDGKSPSVSFALAGQKGSSLSPAFLSPLEQVESILVAASRGRDFLEFRKHWDTRADRAGRIGVGRGIPSFLTALYIREMATWRWCEVLRRFFGGFSVQFVFWISLGSALDGEPIFTLCKIGIKVDDASLCI